MYHIELEYLPIESATLKHCYVHPLNIASHWELNKKDKSYKRPVCEGCAILPRIERGQNQ